MNFFIKKAEKLGVEKIIGKLSSVDLDHRDRAIHFYKKFKFSINNSSLTLYLE